MTARAETRLDGRYRLIDRIAVGGMGEVWRGRDEVLGRTVAVKILRAELAEDDAFRRRFRAEARTAGGLPHNGIAAVFDYGETTVGPDGVSPSGSPLQGDGIAYLVMELVPGEALSTILGRDGALGTERTLSLVSQAARALHAAHLRGVVHRDVKPANLMVTPEGRVKVTDFGIARPRDHEPLTMTGQVMGTAHYLAPELARGEEASPLSDVYALGVVAYECLAGHRPFEGDNQVLVATAHLSQQPPPLPGTIAPDVVRVVGAAMEKDKADRIGSAEAFAIALEKLLAHDPTALDGIGGHDQHPGGLHSAQAPAPVPDVPPAPPRRTPSGSPSFDQAAETGPVPLPVSGGQGQRAGRTVTISGAAASPGSQWISPDTEPQGTAVGAGRRPSGRAVGGPDGPDGSDGPGVSGGRAGLVAAGGVPGRARPPSVDPDRFGDDPQTPRRRLPRTALLVALGVLVLVVAGAIAVSLSLTGGGSAPLVRPSTPTTNGPTQAGPTATNPVQIIPTTVPSGTRSTTRTSRPSKTSRPTRTGSPSALSSGLPTPTPTAPSSSSPKQSPSVSPSTPTSSPSTASPSASSSTAPSTAAAIGGPAGGAGAGAVSGAVGGAVRTTVSTKVSAQARGDGSLTQR